MSVEAIFQINLIKKLQMMFPNGFILKNDPTEYQGIPDILILVGDRWAMLEVKREVSAEIQPNQEFYVDMFNRMSFAAFIYPENEEEVLRALQSALGTSREARLSKSQ